MKNLIFAFRAEKSMYNILVTHVIISPKSIFSSKIEDLQQCLKIKYLAIF